MLDFTEKYVSVGLPSTIYEYQYGIQVEVIKKVQLSTNVNRIWQVLDLVALDLLDIYLTVALDISTFKPI